MVLVCLVSLYGTWRADAVEGLAAVMALTAVVLEILWGRRNKQVLPGGMAEGCEEQVQIREEVRAWPRPPYLPLSLPWF